MKICEPAIFELLKAVWALQYPALAATPKIYALRAPDNDQGPFWIFQRIDSERWRDINAPAGIAQAQIMVDAYDPEYYKCKAAGAAIEDALDGFSGTVQHGSDSPQAEVVIGGITLQNDVDILDQTEKPLLFRSSATYLVTYNQ